MCKTPPSEQYSPKPVSEQISEKHVAWASGRERERHLYIQYIHVCRLIYSVCMQKCSQKCIVRAEVFVQWINEHNLMETTIMQNRTVAIETA